MAQEYLMEVIIQVSVYVWEREEGVLFYANKKKKNTE